MCRYSQERYEQKLAAEREIGLRLKGENGIMKKKVCDGTEKGFVVITQKVGLHTS